MLESIVEMFTDRMPAVPSKLLMSRETADALMVKWGAKDVEAGQSPPMSGIEINFSAYVPFGDWMEWDGERWRPRVKL